MKFNRFPQHSYSSHTANPSDILNIVIHTSKRIPINIHELNLTNFDIKIMVFINTLNIDFLSL